MILQSLWLLIYYQIRPLIKWFLRKTTKLCELQRICYGCPSGFQRSYAIDLSLTLSKSKDIQSMIKKLNDLADRSGIGGPTHRGTLEYAVTTVLTVKKIKPSLHRVFIVNYCRCIEHIWGYRQLYNNIENVRLTQYDSSLPEHEEKLLNLWKALKPDEALESRITRQWQDIGFQGDDPKTDFRGMGLLGLENLLFFSTEYKNAASHVLSHSLHPTYGYAFAIVGINITSMAYNLVKDETAKTHIYNICKGVPSVRVFHQFYSYLFYEFDKFWLASKPKNVMEFTFIKEKFEENIRKSLSDPSCVFSIDFFVDTI